MSTTALGLLLLSGLGWAMAGLIQALLRRGIQITYIVPMTPRQEDRMLQGLRFVFPFVFGGAGVWAAFGVGPPAGGVAAGIVAVVLAAIWSPNRQFIGDLFKKKSPTRHVCTGSVLSRSGDSSTTRSRTPVHGLSRSRGGMADRDRGGIADRSGRQRCVPWSRA